MSWAFGIDSMGREVGYSVQAECDEPGCSVRIDRGVSHRCGLHHGDHGCGYHFCEEHLSYHHEVEGNFCLRCLAELPEEDEEA